MQQLKPTMCEIEFSVFEGMQDSCRRVFLAVKCLVLKTLHKKIESGPYLCFSLFALWV